MANMDFDLREEREMPEVGGIARRWLHRPSGAEVLSICNDDENKCFGVNFYTPPQNSTGVAHILEHSVLCGSSKYPLKEPFVELLKGSLQTFLNAFTFPDKTCYPVASANLRDFYNLIDVYVDAVFHPLLTENIFRQEGWHLEPGQDGKWNFKGVVFNEMKGVYSQADSMLAEKSQQAVFPDNLYSLDSGGNPEVIPELTWRDFRAFHDRYYHPSNAKFFFWGDDPEEKRLEIVANAVGAAKKRPEAPSVPLQKTFGKPRRLEGFYPAEKGEKRALFTINWLLPERGNVLEALKMEMLEHILEGMPGSPLRRALIESGLGEDTTGCGLETDLRQMYYSTGLKGIEPENVAAAEELIFAALKELVENGIPAPVAQSAFNSVEFAYRENNSGRFPRGLAAMVQALSTWLYGGNPLDALAWEKPLNEIREKMAAGKKIFEEAIRKYFLENPHRITVTLLPDSSLAAKRLALENDSIAKTMASLSQGEVERLEKIAEELRDEQLKPDSPEDLAKIPSLAVNDMPRENKKIASAEKRGRINVLRHDIPANGILYANLLLPVKKLPTRLLPYIPLFCRSLVEWGTRKESYADLGLKIGSLTGGVGAAPIPGMNINKKQPFLYIGVQGKVVESHIDDLFGIFSEILLDAQDDPAIIRDRLGRMILEEKARMEYGLQAAGNATVSMRIRSHYRPDQAFTEKFAGVSQLRFLRELETSIAREPEKVMADFFQLRNAVFASSGALLDLTGDGSLIEKGMAKGEAMLAQLPESPVAAGGEIIAESKPLADLPLAEAFITQGQVNYVGKGANLYDLGYSYNGSVNVILRWLRMGPLWENVRVAGGAYGAGCSLDKAGGTFVCASYRDPNVEETLAVYDRLGSFLHNFTPSQNQLSQAIVGAVGDMDMYLLPDAKGARALAWHLAGETDETRQKTREEILSTTVKDFRGFAEVLNETARKGAICVTGGEKTAEAAARLGWVSHKL